jgi:hypothetical protein
MENIIPKIYVGSDKDVAKAKERGYSRVCACKDGPDGHRAMLGYETLGAPRGPEYLFAVKPHWAAMNVVDNDDPSMISNKMIFAALRWAKKEYDAGKTILFHCNHGHERGPTTAFMFMRAIGEMPQGFLRAEKIFKTLYPPFDLKGKGMLVKARELWKELEHFFEKE